MFIICNTPRLIYDLYLTAYNLYKEFYQERGQAPLVEDDVASWNNATTITTTDVNDADADSLLGAVATTMDPMAAANATLAEATQGGGSDDAGYWRGVFMVRLREIYIVDERFEGG